jgi:hypothetical protein
MGCAENVRHAPRDLVGLSCAQHRGRSSLVTGLQRITLNVADGSAMERGTRPRSDARRRFGTDSRLLPRRPDHALSVLAAS